VMASSLAETIFVGHILTYLWFFSCTNARSSVWCSLPKVQLA